MKSDNRCDFCGTIQGGMSHHILPLDKDYILCCNCTSNLFWLQVHKWWFSPYDPNPNKNTESYAKQFIPYKIKWAVWKRDSFKCKQCGTQENLSIDHILPECMGGKLELDNLQTLCRSCNSKKGTKYSKEWLNEKVKYGQTD